MNAISRQLLFASALGIAALGANAQPPSSTTPPSTAAKADQTQADRDYETAKAACAKERSRTARGECLRRADDNYSRAAGKTGAPLSGAGGSGGGSHEMGSSVKARS